MTDRADVAALTAMGFDVFPCWGVGSARVKQPRTLGRDWRDGPPPGGWQWEDSDLIGVNLPRGTVVLDIDDPEKFKASGLKMTRSVFAATRRPGGLHVYYASDRPVDQVTEGGTFGYDTRVGGLGYVIAWEPDQWRPVADWASPPEWLYERRAKPTAADRDPDAPMETRLDILSFLGTFPSRGIAMSKDDYFSLLMVRRAKGLIVALDAKRPWTDEDLRELAAEATKWEVAKPGGTLDLGAATEALAHGSIVNIREYLSNVPLEVPWIIDGIAFNHGVTLLAGSPKAGKSTFAFDLMRCRESGDPFIGLAVSAGPTLLVTEEGGVPIRYKGGALRYLDVYDRKASAGESFVDTLNVIADWADEHVGGVVFIDTLAAWAGLDDENDSAEITKAIDNVRTLAEARDIAVILVHHTRKGGGDYGEGIRGSGAILASVDHVLELTRPSPTHDTRRKVSVMSRVLPANTSWLMDWDPMDRRYTLLDADEVAATSQKEDLAPFADKFPRIGGITRAEARERGVGETRLRRLVNNGNLRAIPVRGGATLYIDIRVPERGDDGDVTDE